jgi:hypothetical protein
MSLRCQKNANSPLIQMKAPTTKVRTQMLSSATFISPSVSFITKVAPLNVITSCLIFRLSPLNLALQLLCVVGFSLGIAIFLRGLRLRRIRVEQPASLASIPWEANSHSFPQRTEKVAAAPIQDIIRLSPDPAPMKSAEMSQQQKIAAALARSSSSNSTAWLHESYRRCR